MLFSVLHFFFVLFFSFFFNDTATTEIYTLSLHDALPIYLSSAKGMPGFVSDSLLQTDLLFFNNKMAPFNNSAVRQALDRKSTRLNSSHVEISYAVFCLKKKKKQIPQNYSYISIITLSHTY